MPNPLLKLFRPHILNVIPYSAARDEFKGEAKVYLDANENAWGNELGGNHRYPDPLQWAVKAKISKIKNANIENIFIGNGSDEPIDLMVRAFCEPQKDKILIMPPTYGMYKVSAEINNIEAIEVPLLNDFQIDVEQVKKHQNDKNLKIIFICSPNNPSGNNINHADILTILKTFSCAVVVDEAYIDYSEHESWLNAIKDFPNLMVLQTLSKAWGMAALRMGLAFADSEIIQVLNKIKPPYNINSLSQNAALIALYKESIKNKNVNNAILERKMLEIELLKMPLVIKVFPSDANFLLVKTSNPKKIYHYLTSQGIIVRDRSGVKGCEGCLRITIGTDEENRILLATWNQLKKEYL